MRDGTKSLEDIATETFQPVSKVRELQAEYVDMAGSLSIDKAALDTLRALLGDDAVLSGERLIAALRARLGSRDKTVVRSTN